MTVPVCDRIIIRQGRSGGELVDVSLELLENTLRC